MKSLLIPAAVFLALASGVSPAMAKGCAKGAVVGGVAGHIAGHHGLAGAGVGCAVGHHEANKSSKQQTAQNGQDAQSSTRMKH